MDNEDSNEATEGAKRIASPFLTGGGGLHFEENVQTSFVVLMLSDGLAPCIDNCAIKSIHCQTKHLHCRHFNKEALDIPRTVKSLWDAVNTKESAARMDQYDIIQLISALQDDQNTPKEDLVRIEWAYSSLAWPS